MGTRALTRTRLAAIGRNGIAIRMRCPRGGMIMEMVPDRHAVLRMAMATRAGATAISIRRYICGCPHRLVWPGGHAHTGNGRRHPVQRQHKHQHQTQGNGPSRHARYFNRTGHEV